MTNETNSNATSKLVEWNQVYGKVYSEITIDANETTPATYTSTKERPKSIFFLEKYMYMQYLCQMT